MLTMILTLSLATEAAIQLIQTWQCPSPAFLHTQNGTLFVTQFSGSPFTAGSIVAAFNVNTTQQQPTFVTVASKGLLWPNEMTAVPNVARALVVGDGFLPPGKSTGSISLLSWTALNQKFFNLTKLTTDKPDWFYHRAVFVDVNNDGLLDILTARAYDSVFTGGRGELLWLEAPTWREHHLADGPDINFDVQYLRNSAQAPFIVYAAEFFGKQLTAFRVEVGGNVSVQAVIDASIDEVYDVHAVDLNGSGALDTLLVTNYHYSSRGALFAYSLGQITQPTSFVRTTIFDQFQNVQYGVGSGAPGFIYAHYAASTVPPRGARPNILVSGDGAQAAYLFAPTSSGGNASDYTLVWTKSYSSTVGAMLVHDWQRTGVNPILIALSDTNVIEVYSY